jgi:hypothetical protein
VEEPVPVADKVALWGSTVILALGATLFHLFLQAGWCGFFNGGPTDEQLHYCESIRETEYWGIIVASMPGTLLAVGTVTATKARSGRIAAARWIAALVIAGIVFLTIPFVVVGGRDLTLL